MALTVVKSSGIDITGNYTVNGMTITANVSAANANLGNSVTANYFIGNGALLTGIAAGYSNTNVAAYLPTYTGNVSANYFIGNGSTLTYITGANITGNVTSAVQSHYANIANSVAGSNISGQVGNALVAGTVYTNAQPNITSVGTLSSLSVSGDATVTGNFTVGGNTTYINVETFRVEDPIIELGGGVNGAALTTNDGKDRGTLLHYYTTGVVDAFMGWDNSNGEFAFGSNVSVSSEVVTFNNFGNIRASYFIGNGSQLTGTIANANYSTYAGTVITAAQPNITSVGSLSGLTVSNATGVVDFTTTANVTLGAVSNLHISGGTDGYVLKTNGSGTLAWVAQPTPGGSDTQIQFNDGGSFGGNSAFTFNKTTGNVVITGNLVTGSGTGGNISGLNYVTGNYLTGTLTTAIQPNITSVGTLASLTVTGNVTSGNASLGNLATASYFTGNGSLLTNITGSNVNGNVTNAVQSHYANIANSVAGSNVSGQVGNALVAGTVYTNAQPNITSVGSLTGLTISNATGVVDFTTTANVTLGAVANLHISGGTDGYVLKTNGSGTLTWVAQTSGGTPGGSDTQVQFNDGGSFGGNSAFTFNKTTGNVVITGNLITGSGTGGNISGLNYVTANYLTGTLTTAVQPNITSVGILASLTVTGNITSGNASLGNLATASYFTGNGSLLTYITGSNVNGNVTSAVQSHFANIANSVAGSNISGQVGNALVAGTVYTNAQPNITSVGTLVSLSITGNVTSGNASLGNLATASYFSGDGSLLTGITGTYSNSNVAAYLPTYTGNFTAGNANISGSITTGSGSGNISGANYINANFYIGNGSLLTGLPASYSNTNVAAYLPTYTGNVSANYFIGDGSLLTGLPSSYSNANVAAYLPTYTGNFSAGNANISGSITTGSGTGNISGANYVVANYFSGNGSLLTSITGANVTGNVTSAVQSHFANIANSVAGGNVSGQVGNALIAGTVYTNAQPNITSVGSLTSLTVTGNVSANYYIGNGSLLTGLPSSYSNANVAAYLPTYTGNFTAGNANISGSLVAGTITTGSGSGNISGANYVVANYFSGNGSLLTSLTGANVTGYVPLSTAANTAATVTTNAQPNITSVGTLVSLNVSGDATVTGNFTVGGNTNYINVDTLRIEDPVIEIGGGVNGAPLTSNDGKDRGSLLHYYTTGVVDAFMGWDNSNGEFAFGSNVSVSSEVVTFNNFGNIRASYFIGNGSTLTYITGSNVNGNVTSAVQSHFANIANSVAGSNVSGQVGNALVAGTVYTNAQPNITSVGTLASLTVTANITSGNASLGNLVTANYFSGDGSLLTGLPAGYANSNVAAYLPTYTGNVSANYFIGNGSTLTTITGANVNGNVTSAVQSHYANIANSVAGGNVSGQVGNALVAGTVYTNAQPNITSVGTLASLSVTGNITSGNASLGNLVIANYFSGNGSLLTGITSSSATTAGTVTTNAQPNITSVGSLSGLTVSNATGIVDFTTTANVTLGSVSNLHISGGTLNDVLSTDGSGTLSWVAQGSGSVTVATVDTYTGNGSETVFMLTTTPSSINDTIVNYNGVILQKAVYSLTDANITFVAPPASGSSLEITTLGVVSTNDLTTTGKAIAMAIVFGF